MRSREVIEERLNELKETLYNIEENCYVYFDGDDIRRMNLIKGRIGALEWVLGAGEDEKED